MIQIAIDGPGGAGKSTVAKAVAKKLDILYVDTGALYRTVGLFVKMNGVEPRDSEAVAALLPKIDIEVKYEEGTQCVYLNGVNYKDAIRTPEMSMYASIVSAIPEVRAFLLKTQKDIAKKNSVIMDGRDIGTCVLPGANVKVYLTADPKVRAKRRFDELTAKGEVCDIDKIEADIIERDYRDMNREISPLKQAEDAILVDTSYMTIEENVQAILDLIK